MKPLRSYIWRGSAKRDPTVDAQAAAVAKKMAASLAQYEDVS